MTLSTFVVLMFVAIVGLAVLEEFYRKHKKCTWTHDFDYWTDHWEASCGGAFQFECGNPDDNDMKFCCYCGGKLVSVETKEEGDDDEQEG